MEGNNHNNHHHHSNQNHHHLQSHPSHSKSFTKALKSIFPKKLTSSSNIDDIDDEANFRIETIDQAPIQHCESFIADCDTFLFNAEKALTLVQKSKTNKSKYNPLVFSSTINKWRAKRKGNKLYNDFENLLTKSGSIESELKTMIDKSLLDSSALVIQAIHIRSRLQACIDFNSEKLNEVQPDVLAAEEYVERLRLKRNKVKEMLDFHDELEILKENTPYVPWALRDHSVPEHYHKAFPRDVLEKKLENYNYVIGIFERILKDSSPLMENYLKNYENAKRSILAMDHLLVKINGYLMVSKKNLTRHKSVDVGVVVNDNPILAKRFLTDSSWSNSLPAINASLENEKKRNIRDDSSLSTPTKNITTKESQSPLLDPGVFTMSTEKNDGRLKTSDSEEEDDNGFPTSNIDELIEEIPPYDHSHCADCAFVNTMANDCSMHLAALHHFAQESTIKLQKLIMKREKIKEKAHDLEESNWAE